MPYRSLIPIGETPSARSAEVLHFYLLSTPIASTATTHRSAMSSTLAPSTLSPNNPVTPTSVTDTLAKLNLKPNPKDLDDYTSLLTGIWEVWNKVDQMEDYVPVVDEAKYARKEVHRPEGKENAWNAWAWKCKIEGTGKGGLLKGKTVVFKVSEGLISDPFHLVLLSFLYLGITRRQRVMVPRSPQDNVAVKGVPCMMGTAVFSDWTPNTDATIVTRILETGGTVVGKAVCENLSLWGVSLSAATGRLNNVHAAGYSAGGSSSGTGVLVARGEVDLGIGGDQGGSIRIPAACQGLVGLKPTTGLVPYTGIASLEPVIDITGPMTRVSRAL